MKASAVAAQRRPALRVVRLERDAFAASWGAIPEGAIAVGLRLVSDSEESQARRESAALASQAETLATRIDEYNDALVAGIVGAALCDPNDQAKPPRELPLPRDMARDAFTSQTLRRLFNELDVMAAEASPAAPSADDEDLVALVERLTAEDCRPSNRARRLAAELLREFEE